MKERTLRSCFRELTQEESDALDAFIAREFKALALKAPAIDPGVDSQGENPADRRDRC